MAIVCTDGSADSQCRCGKAACLCCTHRNEQEEAAILDTVMSALTERLTGQEFRCTQEIENGAGDLTIHIRRRNPSCKIRIVLEI